VPRRYRSQTSDRDQWPNIISVSHQSHFTIFDVIPQTINWFLVVCSLLYYRCTHTFIRRTSNNQSINHQSANAFRCPSFCVINKITIISSYTVFGALTSFLPPHKPIHQFSNTSLNRYRVLLPPFRESMNSVPVVLLRPLPAASRMNWKTLPTLSDTVVKQVVKNFPTHNRENTRFKRRGTIAAVTVT